MNSEMTVQRAEAVSGQDAKAQLASYLAQQTEAKQTFHKWIKVAEMAGLAIAAGAFGAAMYASINHTAFAAKTIATAWIAFPISLVPLMILLGVHAIVLRVTPPIVVPGKRRQFLTGSRAVWSGAGQIVSALLVGAFWGVLAWAVWVSNMATVGNYARILGTVMGVAIPVAIVGGIVMSLYQRLVRSL